MSGPPCGVVFLFDCLLVVASCSSGAGAPPDGGGGSPGAAGSPGAGGDSGTGGAQSGGAAGTPGIGGATGGFGGGGAAGGMSGNSAGVDAGIDSAASGVGGMGPAGSGGHAGAGGGGPAGASGTSGSSGGGQGGGGGSGPFTCNLMVGPSPMYQFFSGGFLTYPGIDATRWELIWVAGHYTNAWAMPGDPAWNTTVSHPCAHGSATPDRVIFMATQWTENTANEWETDFDGIIKNIRTKWPAVKRIELMPSTSTPGDTPCPGNGPEKSETMIPAYGYEAIDAMPANYPGLVFSTPHFEVPSCSDFINDGGGPQYAPNATATTGPAILEVAGVFGAYYAAHP